MLGAFMSLSRSLKMHYWMVKNYKTRINAFIRGVPVVERARTIIWIWAEWSCVRRDSIYSNQSRRTDESIAGTSFTYFWWCRWFRLLVTIKISLMHCWARFVWITHVSVWIVINTSASVCSALGAFWGHVTVSKNILLKAEWIFPRWLGGSRTSCKHNIGILSSSCKVVTTNVLAINFETSTWWRIIRISLKEIFFVCPPR